MLILENQLNCTIRFAYFTMIFVSSVLAIWYLFLDVNMRLTYQGGAGTLQTKKDVLKYLLDGTVKSVPEGIFDVENESGKDLDSSISYQGVLSHVINSFASQFLSFNVINIIMIQIISR